MYELTLRLQLEQDTKQRLLQTDRRDYIARLLLQRIDREIDKIKRLLDEKTNKPAMPSHTRGVAPCTKEAVSQYRNIANRNHSTIPALFKETTLCKEGAYQ